MTSSLVAKSQIVFAEEARRQLRLLPCCDRSSCGACASVFSTPYELQTEPHAQAGRRGSVRYTQPPVVAITPGSFGRPVCAQTHRDRFVHTPYQIPEVTESAKTATAADVIGLRAASAERADWHSAAEPGNPSCSKRSGSKDGADRNCHSPPLAKGDESSYKRSRPVRLSKMAMAITKESSSTTSLPPKSRAGGHLVEFPACAVVTRHRGSFQSSARHRGRLTRARRGAAADGHAQLNGFAKAPPSLLLSVRPGPARRRLAQARQTAMNHHAGASLKTVSQLGAARLSDGRSPRSSGQPTRLRMSPS